MGVPLAELPGDAAGSATGKVKVLRLPRRTHGVQGLLHVSLMGTSEKRRAQG